MRFVLFFVSSSLLICLVLLIRSLFRKKLAPGVIYALWLIPLMRLMVPFGTWELPVFGAVADILNTPYSLISELTNEEETSEKQIFNAASLNNQTMGQTNSKVSGTKIYDEVIPAAEKQPERGYTISEQMQTDTANRTANSFEWVLLGVWFTGSVLLGCYVVLKNRKLSKSVDSLECVDEVNGISVYISDDVSTPCLVGLLRPRIVISRDVLNDKTLCKYVLQHELTHYRQKDHIWTAFKIFMCVIYWWNPLVWVAASCVTEDAELACDAKVLKGQSIDERKVYGYALLQLLENAGRKEYDFCIATSMSGGKKSMKRRIKEITANTVTKQRVLLPTILLMVTVLILGCGVPSDKSWIKTAEWTIGDNGDATYSEAEYSYVLQEDIQSCLFFSEIYEYGELTTRQLLSYGKIENAKETVKLRRESSKTIDEEKLVVEFNGIGIEMPVLQPQYLENQDYASSGGALNSDSDKIEIIPETDYILLADFRAGAGKKIQTYDCLELSFYTEKELQETLKKNHFTTFVRCVFSQKPVQELYQSYQQKEYPANDKTADEQWAAKILKINDILYYGTDETGPMGDSGAVGGHIQSTVDENKVPQENEESNFGCIGNPYTWDAGDGMIMVFMDDEEYHVFQRMDEMTSEGMATAWANAFVERNAYALSGMASEEVRKSMVEYAFTDEELSYFGFSSPWPMSETLPYHIEILQEDDSRAEILYYAIDSTPKVYAWKETLGFEKVGEKMQVASWGLEYLWAIHNIEDFYKAYPYGIEDSMMNYNINGLGEILNQNALLSSSTAYQPLFDAGTAALELLNISKDEELVYYSVEDNGETATVEIYFLGEGGKSDVVEVTMWQPYGEEGIWIPK